MNEESEFYNERELWRTKLNGSISALSWSQDTNWLCIGTEAGIVAVINTEEAKVKLKSENHTAGKTFVCHSPVSTIFISGGQDGIINLWKTETGEKIQCTQKHQSGIKELQWSPDGRFFCSASSNDIIIWSSKGEVLNHLMFKEKPVTAFNWNSKSDSITIALENRILNVKPTEKEPKEIEETTFQINKFLYSKDENYLGIGTKKDWVQIFRPGTNNISKITLGGYDGEVRDLSWQSHTNIVAATGSNQISFWKISDNTESDPLVLIGHKYFVNLLHFQAKGKILASGDEAGIILFWLPDVKKELIDIARMKSSITSLSWSPDDSELAVGTAEGELIILAAPAGE